MGDVMVPILKDTKDPHYRYKMPKLTAKVEGSGNGIRTVITNMTAIARALDRPPTYPTKYFGCELGAQVTMNNEYVVNGSHDPEKLMKLLYDFIRKFVLCSKCNNPETTLTISNQTIRQKCIACGHESTIPKTIHKLTTFIINHPPDGSNPIVTSSTKGSSKTKSVNGNSSGKSKSKKGEKNGNNGVTNQTNDNKNNDSGDSNTNINNEEDEFDEDEFTTDAYTERMRELRGNDTNNSMYLSDTKESANMFFKLVKEKKEANLIMDANVQKELVKEAERLEIKDKSTLILSELLFTENIIEEIKSYRLLLLRFCNENKKAQKYLLGGYEKLVGDVYKDKLFNNALKILKQFYDLDIIEEETIIEWSSKASKKYVSKEMSKKIHEKVEPFVKWLKEAEVEEDSEEESMDNQKKQESTAKQNGNSASTNGNGNHQSKQSLENDDNDEDEEDDELFEFSHRVSGIHIESLKPVAATKAVNADIVADATANGKEKHDEEDLDIDQI